MKTKFIILALSFSSFFLGAQVSNDRPAEAFTKLEISGAMKVFYTTSDTAGLNIVGSAGAVEKIQTIYKDGVLLIDVKGRVDEEVTVHISNKEVNSVMCSGACTFKTTNKIKGESISFESAGASNIKAEVEEKKVSATAAGASNITLSGTSDELKASCVGASTIKAYDLIAKTADVQSAGASTAKIYASEKVNAVASGASSVKIKGEAKDISAESTSASSITRIMENGESTGARGNGDSTTINWKGKKVIIIDGEKRKKMKVNMDGSWDHWAGFSIGVNGLLTADAMTKMEKPFGYMDLNYSRSINIQFNPWEKRFHLYKNYVNVVTGVGFEWRRYMLDHKTTLDPDSSFTWGRIDSTNTYSYNKNLFKSTLIQVPLLIEFNTSKKANKSFHIAVGAIGQFMISSKTKQILEKDGDEFTKKHRDTYNMMPWSVKAHASIGYSAFTVFAEYNITPLFEKGSGPQVYPFVAGVRLLAF
jgi:hypothetical protein